MRRIAFRSIIAVLISVSFSAGKALAEGTLVLVNEEGEEVLRLDEENLSSGLHALELGRYLLKVDAPGTYSVLIGNSTVVQIDRIEEEGFDDSAQEEEFQSHTDEGDLPSVVLDANLDPGDQGQREAVLAETGDRIEFQLTAHDLPEIYGWSLTLVYDPEQIAYVADSFSPSVFVSDIMILARDLDGGLEIGGANFTKDLASGDGDLGNLGFEVLAGFSGRAELKITEFIVRKLHSIDPINVWSEAAIVSELSPDTEETGAETVVQIDRIEEEGFDDSAQEEEFQSHTDEGDLPSVVLDANLDPGDQGQREAVLAETGDRIEFQLTAHDLPEIYGWSLTLVYDPEQIAYVADSFSPSVFVSDIMILARDLDGGLEIGGANFTKDLASGDGDLGNLGFEVLAGFSGRAELKITEFIVRKLHSIDPINVWSGAAIVSELSPIQRRRAQRRNKLPDF